MSAYAPESIRATSLTIAVWLVSLRHRPTVQQIRDRWNVSRATAYRWLREIDAIGIRYA
jgi:predicted DNA-binding transcriptional regulator YafY